MERQPPADADRNKDLVRRFVDEVWNGRDLDAIDRFISASFVDHDSDGSPDQRAEFRQSLTDTFDLSPDVRYEIDDLIAEDDKVVVRYTFRGTDSGEVGRLKPSGKVVVFDGIDLYRLAEGRIVERWSYQDPASLQRLGLMPDVDPEAMMGRRPLMSQDTKRRIGCATIPAAVLALGLLSRRGVISGARRSPRAGDDRRRRPAGSGR